MYNKTTIMWEEEICIYDTPEVLNNFSLFKEKSFIVLFAV